MNDSNEGSPFAGAGGKVRTYAKRRWRVLLVAAAAAVLLPFAARGPAAGASQLLGLLQDPFYPSANKAVAAQAVWMIFSSAPWSREQIVRDSDGVELWLRLMHLQNAALVERSASMTYSVATHSSLQSHIRQHPASRHAEARRLAAAMTLPLCSDRCQGSLILTLSHMAATQPADLQTLAQSPALSTIVAWSGISCNHSSPKACPHRDAFVSSSAAALLINMAGDQKPHASCMLNIASIHEQCEVIQSYSACSKLRYFSFMLQHLCVRQ